MQIEQFNKRQPNQLSSTLKVDTLYQKRKLILCNSIPYFENLKQYHSITSDLTYFMSTDNNGK